MSELIVAGPILRRVTPDLVCVWLLTTQPINLKLTILQDGKLVGENDPALIEQQRYTLGEQMFVYLLQAKPSPSPADQAVKSEQPKFLYDKLLNYQISIIVDGKNRKKTEQPLDFKKMGLTYGTPHPSFFIGKNLKNILHGSCRKPHGNAKPEDKPDTLSFLEKLITPLKDKYLKPMIDSSIFTASGATYNYDALSLADSMLEENHNNLEKRPDLLLLTGDQIYADDVADSIYDLVKKQGKELLGFQERLPGVEADPSTIDRQGRRQLAADTAGFSSEALENHLFTFGEYAAMYVYIFGNALNWQPNFGSDTNNRKTALSAFHDSLPNVRRLLANVPTYMIFDDHDVTDDWNINGGWYEKVRNLPLGRRVVANALAAYWVFQGWGNRPDDQDLDFVTAVTAFLRPPAQDPNHKTGLDSSGERYDLFTWKHRGWSYSIPTTPPIIVLDSRTQRQPDRYFYPPQLLDRYALDWLKTEWSDLKKLKNEELKQGIIEQMPEYPVFIATTPVMGLSLVEGIQQLGLWFITWFESLLFIKIIEKMFHRDGIWTYKLVTALDIEAWIANREGFGNFLNCLLSGLDLERCVFLSGDVHYSFSASSQFINNENKRLYCWQLTSSSLSNIPDEKQIELMNKIVKDKGKAKHNNRWAINPAQRWNTIIDYLPNQANPNTPVEEFVVWKANIGLIQFEQGVPKKHILVRGKAVRDVFELPSDQP